MKMKRFLSLVISTAMTLSAFSGFVTSASAEVISDENTVSWFASASDGTPIEGADPETQDCAAIAKDTDLMAGTDCELIIMGDGCKFKKVEFKGTDEGGNSVETPAGLTGRLNNAGRGDAADFGTTGTGLKFTAKADGVIDVYAKVNNGKTFVVNKADGSERTSWVNNEGTNSQKRISAPVKADETYYIYAEASGLDLFGLVFRQGAEYVPPVIASKEPATPKPVVTLDPNAKVYEWNVSENDLLKKTGDLLMTGLSMLFDNYSTNKKYISDTRTEGSGKITDGVASGSSLQFIAPEDGKLEVTMIDVGDVDKQITPVIYDAQARNDVFTYTTAGTGKETVNLWADVEAGKTYYITATGTKGRFSAAKFTPAAQGGDATAAPTGDPSGDATAAPVGDGITYENGTATVKADGVTEGVLIIASYEGNKLTGLETRPLAFTNGAAAVSNLTLTNGTKLMAWKDMKSMEPICPSYTVSGSSATQTPATTQPTSEPEDSDTVVFRADDARIAAMTTAQEDNGKGGFNTVISPAQEMGIWTVQPGWQVKNASNIKYTHTDGTEYTFTKSLYAGSGSTTSRAVSFVPKGSCKVTAVFDGTGQADRVMNIAQNGTIIASAKSVAGETSAVVAEITDTSAPVYVYGGGSNKNLYAVIVEYMEPETQADYVKAWNFQQVNYGKAEGVADGLVCNDNTADQKNDGSNGKGFLTGSNGGEIKVPVEADKLNENKVAVVKVTYNWDANFDFEGIKTYEQSQGGDNIAEYIYDASCVNDGFVTINTNGTTYIKKIERTTLFKAPVTGTITSKSTKDLAGKNIVFTDKASGNVVKAPYGATYSAELVNGREYAVSVEGMTDICPTLETMNFTANVKKTEFNIELMDIAESEVTGEVVGLDNPAGITLTFTNASDEAKTVNAVITNAETPDTKNLNPVTGTLSAVLMPNNTYNVTASGLPDGYSLSPLSQSYFMKAGDTKPFKNILIVKDTPVVDYTTLADGTINVGPNGDYKTINEAIAVVKKMTNRGNNRVTLNLEAGATFTEQVIVDVNNVTFKSDADNKATIQWYYGVGYLYYSAKNGYYDRDLAVAKTGKNNATKWGCTVYVKGAGFLAENVNFDATLNQKVIDAEIADGVEPAEPGSPQYSDGRGYCPDRAADGFDPKSKAATERAAAMAVEGNNAEFYNCKFQSSQDTLYTGSNAAYFKNCDIYGMTDYIFGGNNVLFEKCNLIWEGYSTEDKNGPLGGYITAVKTSSNTDNGYVFKDCTVAKNSDPVMKSSAGAWGRNWGGTNCAVYFVNTTIAEGAAKPVGWTKMGGELSTSKLFVKGTYAANDTEKATDLTASSDNPNGAMSGEAPADMTVLNNWVPKHYEGERPEIANYKSIWEFGNTAQQGGALLDKAYQGVTLDFTSNTYLGTEAAEDKAVTMKIDATNGKVNPGNPSNGQFNPGTKLIIPVVDGSVLTVKGYSGLEFKINDTAYTTTGTYTHSGTAGTVTVESTGGMAYMEYVTLEWAKNGATPVIPTTEPTSAPTTEPIGNALNIKVDFMGQSAYKYYNTTEAIPENTKAAFSLDKDGNIVADDAENAVAKFENVNYHDSQHGVNGGTITINVPSYTKVTVGGCQFGNTVELKKGDEVLDKNECKTCYSGSADKTDVSSVYYKEADAATLTLQINGYWPYIAIESVTEADIPAEATAAFTLGDGQGMAPAEMKVKKGAKIIIPVNRTVYKEGSTLTGWTDGTNTYAIGQEVTLNDNMTLTPVFTANTKTLADTSVVFDFQRKNGAPAVGWENVSDKFWVGQATVDGTPIDVKMDIDTTTKTLHDGTTTGNGKVANANWDDWAQINPCTEFTVPAVAGAVVAIDAMGADTKLEIGANQFNKEAGYTVKAGDITDGKVKMLNVGGGYTRTITVTYPAASEPIEPSTEPTVEPTVEPTTAPTTAPTEAPNKLTAVANDKVTGDYSVTESTDGGDTVYTFHTNAGKGVDGAGYSFDLSEMLGDNLYSKKGVMTVSMQFKLPDAAKKPSNDGYIDISSSSAYNNGADEAKFVRYNIYNGWDQFNYYGSGTTRVDGGIKFSNHTSDWYTLTAAIDITTKKSTVVTTAGSETATYNLTEFPTAAVDGKLYLNVIPTRSANDANEIEFLIKNITVSYEKAPDVVPASITAVNGTDNELKTTKLGGEVSVDKAAANAGETVTITATPYYGFEVSAVKVSKDGAAAEAITADNGVYSFAVATDAENYDVTAEFVPSANKKILYFMDSTLISGGKIALDNNIRLMNFVSSGTSTAWAAQSLKLDEKDPVSAKVVLTRNGTPSVTVSLNDSAVGSAQALTLENEFKAANTRFYTANLDLTGAAFTGNDKLGIEVTGESGFLGNYWYIILEYAE